jgi:hypothetical protein
LIVAPVRSPGKLCKKIWPSRGDDRTPGSLSAYGFAGTSNHRSSLRDGRVFFTISRHFVRGYYQMSLRGINEPSENASEVLRALGRNDRAHSSKLLQGTFNVLNLCRHSRVARRSLPLPGGYLCCRIFAVVRGALLRHSRLRR